MPVCVLCEGENFDSIDGLYFCQSCGTQSQVSVYAFTFFLSAEQSMARARTNLYTFIYKCKYMKHIFELRMKDEIEERSSQLRKEGLKKIQA